MQIKFLSNILLVTSLFFSSQSQAVTKTFVCNECSASAMKIAATEGPVKYGTSQVVVVDFVNETSRKFTVVSKEDTYGEPLVTASERNLTSAEQQSVLALFDYRRLVIDAVKNAEEINKQLFPNYVNVPSQQVSLPFAVAAEPRLYVGYIKFKGNPYDFLSTSSDRNSLFNNHFKTTTGIIQAAANQVLTTISIPHVISMGVTIDILFYEDEYGYIPAGFVKVGINWGDQTFVPISGIDKNNNSIPMSKQALLNDRYSLGLSGGGDQTLFEKYANFLIVGGSGSGGGGCTLSVKDVTIVGDRYIYIYECK